MENVQGVAAAFAAIVTAYGAIRVSPLLRSRAALIRDRDAAIERSDGLERMLSLVKLGNQAIEENVGQLVDQIKNQTAKIDALHDEVKDVRHKLLVSVQYTWDLIAYIERLGARDVGGMPKYPVELMEDLDPSVYRAARERRSMSREPDQERA